MFLHCYFRFLPCSIDCLKSLLIKLVFTLFSVPLLLQVHYPRRQLPIHINRFLRRVQPLCTHLLWPELQGQNTLLLHQVEHHQAWNRRHEPRNQVLHLAGNFLGIFFLNFGNVLTDRQTLYIHTEFLQLQRIGFKEICHLRNAKGTGAEMCPSIVSGIVT